MTVGRFKILWWFTGVVAVLLLAATAVLFFKAEQVEQGGVVAYIDQGQNAVFLRDQPENDGAVLAILEAGSPVRIGESKSREDVGWYHVDVGQLSGWLQASVITFDPP